MAGKIFAVIILLIVLGGGVYLLNSNGSTTVEDNTNTDNNEVVDQVLDEDDTDNLDEDDNSFSQICITDSDCVLRDFNYCCGETAETAKGCFHRDSSVMAITCEGVGSCPGIALAEACECDAAECVAIISDTGSTTSTPETHTITIKDTGFTPATLMINTGDTVIFEVDTSRGPWPASNIHPTHRLYPGSDISKCPADDIFDACKGLERGETFSFTFNTIGDWRYHDHIRASQGGIIIVR